MEINKDNKEKKYNANSNLLIFLILILVCTNILAVFYLSNLEKKHSSLNIYGRMYNEAYLKKQVLLRENENLKNKIKEYEQTNNKK